MARLRLCAALAVVAVFFVAARDPGVPPLFSSYDTVEIHLTAPFNELISTGQDDYAVSGTLAYAARGEKNTIEDVQISLRGHTSRRAGECTFPKLKLKLPSKATGLFAGVSTVKLGTHCGDAPPDATTSKYGRLRHEHSAHREAFAYRLVDTVGVLTLKARPARATYVYSDARPGQTPDQQQPIVRDAFLLEHDDDAVKRAGGRQQVDEKGFTNARDRFTPEDTAAIAFAEAMIGNFDWCLKMDPADAYRCNARHPLWNVIAVVGGPGRARPLIYDFDVAGVVAGGHRWFKDVYNDQFLPSRSQPAIEVLGQVERTRSLFDRQLLDATRTRFMGRKSAVYDALKSSSLDEPGRRRAQEYLDAFFEAIGSDAAFYRPAVVAPKTLPYLDAARTRPACFAQGAMPIGTVVGEPLQTSGDMIQVVVLDTLWRWGPETKCAEIHQSAVWIEKNSVSRDYPSAEHPRPTTTAPRATGTAGRGRGGRL
jgi:hypothetical protein